MSRSYLNRALVLGIALALAAHSAWAGPRRGQEADGTVWDLGIRLWSEIGCWIDPYGACETAQAPDEGCWLDPHGGCGSDRAVVPSSEADVGCIIDPHGGCRDGG